MRIGGKLDQVFAAAFSPAGLMTGGLAAALAAVYAIVKSIQDEIAAANQALSEMEAVRARLVSEKLEAMGTVGKELAQHGAGRESDLNRATQMLQQSQKEGFDESAAVTVSAAIAASGAQLSDIERRRLIMGQQLGAVDLSKGPTPSSTAKNIQDSLDRINKLGPDLQAAIESAIEQIMRGNNVATMREAARGTPDVAENVLRGLGTAEGDIARKAEELRKAIAWIRKGRPTEQFVTTPSLDEFGATGEVRRETPEEAKARYQEGLDTLHQIEAAIQTKQAELKAQEERARQMFIDAPSGGRNSLSGGWSDVAKPAEHERPWFSPTYDPDRSREPTKIEDIQRDAHGLAAALSVSPTPASQPAQQISVVNYVMHGFNYLNAKDPRHSRQQPKRAF